MNPNIDQLILDIKAGRIELANMINGIDDLIILGSESYELVITDEKQQMESFDNDFFRHMNLAKEHLEDARMRLGLALGTLRKEDPYPNGNNPINTKIDPPADTQNPRLLDESITRLVRMLGKRWRSWGREREAPTKLDPEMEAAFVSGWDEEHQRLFEIEDAKMKACREESPTLTLKGKALETVNGLLEQPEGLTERAVTLLKIVKDVLQSPTQA